jgi:hypothetical protein
MLADLGNMSIRDKSDSHSVFTNPGMCRPFGSAQGFGPLRLALGDRWLGSPALVHSRSVDTYSITHVPAMISPLDLRSTQQRPHFALAFCRRLFDDSTFPPSLPGGRCSPGRDSPLVWVGGKLLFLPVSSCLGLMGPATGGAQGFAVLNVTNYHGLNLPAILTGCKQREVSFRCESVG